MTDDPASNNSDLPVKVSSGYRKLDEALQGGFLTGSAIVLSGPASDEILLLIRSFLSADQEAGLLICRNLSTAQTLMRDAPKSLMTIVCSDKPILSERNIRSGKNIDNLTDLNLQIAEAISSVLPKRAAVDVLSDILLRHKALHTRRWLNELLERLRSKRITALFTLNPYMHPSEEAQAVMDLFDGSLEIVEEKIEGRLGKLLRILWMHDVEIVRKQFPLVDHAAQPRSSDQVTIRKMSLDTRRIAILPFANLSPDPNDEYFADGVTEEIISTVSGIGGLSVISRTSVMSYKGTTKKVREIGNELEVGSIVEGSFRKAGNRIRITAQLIDVASDMHLWAESYDRELTDVFGVQSDIAKQVADSLRIKMVPSEEIQIKKTPTRNTEAHALYLKGRYYWNQRSKEGMFRAISHFQAAVEIDPYYALAYSGIADCYSVLGSHQYIPYVDAFSKSKEYALKAVQLDETSAEAHTSLAMAMTLHDRDFAASEREFLKAIELSPSYATAHFWYGNQLDRTDRKEDALREILRAQELDPLSPIITVAAGSIHDEIGKYDQAEKQFFRALELQPDFVMASVGLWHTYIVQKKFAEAQRWIEAYSRVVKDELQSKFWLAAHYALVGKETEARRAMAEAEELPNPELLHYNARVVYHIALGELAKAVELIESEYKRGADWLDEIKYDPMYAAVRTNPTVQSILRKVEPAS